MCRPFRQLILARTRTPGDYRESSLTANELTEPGVRDRAQEPSTHCGKMSYSFRLCRKLLPTSRNLWRVTPMEFQRRHFFGAEVTFMQRIGYELPMIDLGIVIHCFLKSVRPHVKLGGRSGDNVLNQSVVDLLFNGVWRTSHLSDKHAIRHTRRVLEVPQPWCHYIELLYRYSRHRMFVELK